MPSDLAALRGEPSYVWRAGQERQYALIARYARLDDARVLIDGIGLGLFAGKIRERATPHVTGMDIEPERVRQAQTRAPLALVGAAEALPYPANYFDTLLSHEVIEHVQDDRQSAREMVRVLKPGGRLVLFCPNRWYPFETHGHYWRGVYHFGNTPFINYLPDALRNRLAPHVRAYTRRRLLRLFDDLPVRLVHYRRIYAAYDNWIARLGAPARVARDWLHRLEQTPLDTWGMSHLLVLEKLAPPAA
ncbi:MAG: class I SAM-dependent methyltransferase [Anaerolineae bacterium]|jgi:SAM-dependent methyltransferase|nr:class I SAM-dependent methyltransferase [Anaerolineae bacterium]